jgi:hypothetical protein
LILIRRAPMPRGSLAGYALSFIVGFGLGGFYHHIAHFATSTEAVSDVRVRSVEARLAQLEARLALEPTGRALAVGLGAPPGGSTAASTRAAAAASASAAASATALTRTTLSEEDQQQRPLLSASSSDGGCPAGRKPFHVILTAQDSPYQAWQTRIMVHHLREIRKANPCTEMTGFTRLLSSPKGNLDALASEIPTVTARALDGGNGCRHGGGDTCDMGFPVMNRPHAVTQLLADLPSTITEEYVLIAETDHIFLRDIPNRATPESPACFPFGYMDAKAAELRPVVSRFARDPDSVDPCGPSPVLIHLPLLRKLTPEWLSMSFKLKRDAEAERIFGWVTEMWGYTIAANNLGIKHLVWQNIQLEPSSLWHANLDGDPYIYHYTFGLEFTSDGLPVSTIGEWSLDKRHYMNAYPPRQLEPPPRCAGKAAATLWRLFNEATGNISDWPVGPPGGGNRGAKGWGDGGVGGGVISGVGQGRGGVGVLTDAAYRRSPLAQAAATRGPWKWAGVGPVLFYRGGRIFTPWGSGRWSVSGEALGVSLGSCGSYRLTFNKAMTAFEASAGRGVPATSRGHIDQTGSSTMWHSKEDDHAAGELPPLDGPGGADDGGGDDDAAAYDDGVEKATLKWRRTSDSRVYRRLVGSGPWSWQGVTPVAFLGGGVLHTPWGPGTWEPHPTKGGSTIYANFVGEKHAVIFDECWSFVSVRDRDGDRASGVAKIEPPAKSCPHL